MQSVYTELCRHPIGELLPDVTYFAETGSEDDMHILYDQWKQTAQKDFQWNELQQQIIKPYGTANIPPDSVLCKVERIWVRNLEVLMIQTYEDRINYPTLKTALCAHEQIPENHFFYFYQAEDLTELIEKTTEAAQCILFMRSPLERPAFQNEWKPHWEKKGYAIKQYAETELLTVIPSVNHLTEEASPLLVDISLGWIHNKLVAFGAPFCHDFDRHQLKKSVQEWCPHAEYLESRDLINLFAKLKLAEPST